MDTHRNDAPASSGTALATGVGEDAGQRRRAGLTGNEARADEDDDEDDIREVTAVYLLFLLPPLVPLLLLN